MLAPIILFTYCRPIHTRRTVEALLKNKESKDSDLFVYSDAPKNSSAKKGVEDCRKYIKSIRGFKSIHIVERQSNYGLANNLIDGITHVINQFNKVIVVEDDIVTSPYFLRFMNDALNKYENENNVGSVQGYMYPVESPVPDIFFTQWVGCWGWATWKRAWDDFNADAALLLERINKDKKESKFNMDDCYPFTNMLRRQKEGKIDSWAIRWYASNFLLNRLSLNAGKSLVNSIGNDGIGGVHCSKTNKYDTKLYMSPIEVLYDKSKIHEDAYVRRVLSKAMLKVQRRNVLIKRLIHRLHLSWLMLGYFERLKWN